MLRNEQIPTAGVSASIDDRTAWSMRGHATRYLLDRGGFGGETICQTRSVPQRGNSVFSRSWMKSKVCKTDQAVSHKVEGIKINIPGSLQLVFIPFHTFLLDSTEHDPYLDCTSIHNHVGAFSLTRLSACCFCSRVHTFRRPRRHPVFSLIWSAGVRDCSWDIDCTIHPL
jgi:hypothetical protein